MKKAILLVATIFLFSCSNSDDNSENLNLFGKWTPEVETDYTSNGQISSQSFYSEEPCYRMSTYEFTSNGQFIARTFDQVQNNCTQNTIEILNYTLASNVLSFSGENIDEEDLLIETRIIENTQDVLKLKKTYQGNAYTVLEYSKVD